MQTVIGYARLSSASEESTSIERQREVITATAAARGWHLLEIVEDPSASASKLRLNRPGLTRVRQAIASRQAEAVLVWRLDRIARSVVDFGLLLDEGVKIVSCTEPLDTTTPMGRAMAEILQVFASMEARATSARTAMSVDYLRRNNRFPGGSVPYGYRTCPHPSGTGRALELDPVEAAEVRGMVDKVLAGATVYSIMMDLNARGVPPKMGGPGWRTRTITVLLTGDAILGRVRTRGELVRGPDGLPLTVWPPIVTPEESMALRDLIAPQRRTQPRRKASRLLSGILVCCDCGQPLRVQRFTSDQKTVYRCQSKHNATPCEAAVVINAVFTEAYVVDQFLAVVGRWPVIEQRVIASPVLGLAEVEEEIHATTSAMAERGADLPALMARLAELQARRNELDAASRRPTTEWVETGKTFAEEWQARDGQLDAQRALLASAIPRITVHPVAKRGTRWNADRLEIHWSN